MTQKIESGICYVDFPYKNTNINKQIYKNMFQINETKIESGMWIFLTKNTNINKQIYKIN